MRSVREGYLNTIKITTPLLLLIPYHVVTFMLEDQKRAHKQCAVVIFMCWNVPPWGEAKVHQAVWGSFVFRKMNEKQFDLLRVLESSVELWGCANWKWTSGRLSLCILCIGACPGAAGRDSPWVWKAVCKNEKLACGPPSLPVPTFFHPRAEKYCGRGILDNIGQQPWALRVNDLNFCR